MQNYDHNAKKTWGRWANELMTDDPASCIAVIQFSITSIHRYI